MAGLGAGEGVILLGQPTLAERMMRAWELKGDLPRMLLDQFQPVTLVEDLTREEYYWLQRGRRYARTDEVAAVAAQQALWQMNLNTSIPPGAMIACTEYIVLMNNDAATGLGFTIGLQPLPTTVPFVATEFGPMDDRQQPLVTGPSSFILGVTTTAAPPLLAGEGIKVRVPAGQTIVLPFRFVLTGRMALNIVAANVNQAAGAGVVWRERAALSTES